MAGYDYDLFVIGAGSGGVRAARVSSAYGAKVAIAEDYRVGGTCVIRGCVPKKLYVYASRFADDFADAAGFGWSVGAPSFDWPSLVAAKDKELNRLEGVYGRMLRDGGVTVVQGRGKFADAHTVEVDGKRITGDKILIATGGWPVMPDFPGKEHVISSNEALNLKERPERVVIIGGGYIAVEFAGIFNALGSEVTLVIRTGHLLVAMLNAKELGEPYDAKAFAPRVERAISEVVQRQVDTGIDVVGDGEHSKFNWMAYARARLTGLAEIDSPVRFRGATRVKPWSAALPSHCRFGPAVMRSACCRVSMRSLPSGHCRSPFSLPTNPSAIDRRAIA